MVKVPTVFISYSYDGHDHEDWVKHLVSCLKNDDRIKVIFDKDETYAGDLLDNFMEREITNADMVVAICSQDYTNKANSGVGGVGYEKTILTKKIMDEKNIENTMIIPIIRNNPSKKTPTCFGYRRYIDFEKDSNFSSKLEELVASILRNRQQSEIVTKTNWIENKVKSAKFEFFEFKGFQNLELTKNNLLTAIIDNFFYINKNYEKYNYSMCNDFIYSSTVEDEKIIYLALEPETCVGPSIITARKAFDIVFERLKKNCNENWIFASKAYGKHDQELEVVVYGEKFRKNHDRKVDGIFELWNNPIYDKSPWKVK